MIVGLFKMLGGKRKRRSLISEPINIVTGALGAGKTLFAIEQADLLRVHGDATAVYQIGINDPDLRKLPALPCKLEDWHIEADAGKLNGAVIIVDEFHKWMPQRATGSRPPKFVEEMAEARRRGVRFILLTQSSEFDHFLKGTRLNRHFYLSRKAGIGKATIYEWQAQFVWNPEQNKEAKATAILHQWKHPWKEYGDWYKSADSHHFRIRIPLRLWLVPLFVIGAVFFAVNAFGKVGDLVDGESTIGKALNAKPQGESEAQGNKREVYTKAGEYLQQFKPVVPTMPWSAPAYQGREVVAEPQLLCVIAGAGEDANGEWRDEECRCVTEQMTPYTFPANGDFYCRQIANNGVYNPFKAPYGSSNSTAESEPDGQAVSRPRPAGSASSAVYIPAEPVVTSGSSTAEVM